MKKPSSNWCVRYSPLGSIDIKRLDDATRHNLRVMRRHTEQFWFILEVTIDDASAEEAAREYKRELRGLKKSNPAQQEGEQ